MRREMGVARCGLACCLCSENLFCTGCDACAEKERCENRQCTIARGVRSCWQCGETDCRKGQLAKIRPRTFIRFIRLYGVERLLDCLERNEAQGVVYHRQDMAGDYDTFYSEEALMDFILTGKRNP